MRKMKVIKFFATLLCLCMILGMVPMYAQADGIANNPLGKTLKELANGYTMSNNLGNIEYNNGVLFTNSGHVTYNNNTTVSSNGGISYNSGTIGNNTGRIGYNFGTVSENDVSGQIQDGRSGSTVVNNRGCIDGTDGDVSSNSGYIGHLFGTVKNNQADGNINTVCGTVEVNSGTIFSIHYGEVSKNFNTITHNVGTVSENYGTVVNNYGIVNNKESGHIINEYRIVTISGSNSDKVNYETSNLPVSLPINLECENLVLIKNTSVTSGTITLSPMDKYYFVSVPTTSPECTVTESGTGYTITGITSAITVTVDVATDTPPISQAPAKTLASTNYSGTVLSSWEAVNKALATLVVPELDTTESQVGTAPLLKVNISGTDKVIAKTTQDVIKNENKGLHVHLGDGFAITMIGTNMVKDNADVNAEFTMSDTVKDNKKERTVDFTNKGSLTMNVILHAYLPNATAGSNASIYVENVDGTRTLVAIVAISDLNRICWKINSLQKYVIVY